MEKINFSKKPEDFIITLTNSREEQVEYMLVQGRTIAFRNDYPKGIIDASEWQFVPELNLLVVKARIYDDANNLLAADIGSKLFLNNNSLPEATTQAICRALGRCGYGTAYASPDEGFNGDVSEAGMIVKTTTTDNSESNPDPKTGDVERTEKKARKNRKTKEVESEPVEEVSAKETEEIPSTDVKEENADTEKAEEAAPEAAPIAPSEEISAEPIDSTSDNSSKPVDDLENMTLEQAKKVKILFGQKKGQFMGEVFATDPQIIRFYAERYVGDSKEVKKAAQVILANEK